MLGSEKPITFDISDEELDRHTKLCVILAVLSVGLLFVAVPSLKSTMEMDWDEIQGTVLGSRVILINLSSASIIIASSIILPVMITRKRRMRMFIVIGCCVLIMVILRIKAFASIVALPMIVYVAIVDKKGGGSLRYLFRLAAAGVGFAMLYIVVGVVRWRGALKDLMSRETISLVIEYIRLSPPESKLRSAFYGIMDHFSDEPNLGGISYTRLISSPWSKLMGTEVPENPMYLYNEILHPTALLSDKVMRGSEHPTLYGDVYANFHELGMVMAIILPALLAHIWLRYRKESDTMFWIVVSMMCYSIPLIIRGSVYYGLYTIILCFVMAYVFRHISSFFIRWRGVSG